jgi:acyl carrier protein
MTEAEIVAGLESAFRKTFFDPAIRLDRATTADDVDGWDSLSHVMLLLRIEQQFRIKLSPQETSDLAAVGGLIDLIAAKLAAHPPETPP